MLGALARRPTQCQYSGRRNMDLELVKCCQPAHYEQHRQKKQQRSSKFRSGASACRWLLILLCLCSFSPPSTVATATHTESRFRVGVRQRCGRRGEGRDVGCRSAFIIPLLLPLPLKLKLRAASSQGAMTIPPLFRAARQSQQKLRVKMASDDGFGEDLGLPRYVIDEMKGLSEAERNQILDMVVFPTSSDALAL